MQINQFHVARNVVRQMAQRNLSPEDILAVLRFGHTFYVAGATVFFSAGVICLAASGARWSGWLAHRSSPPATGLSLSIEIRR